MGSSLLRDRWFHGASALLVRSGGGGWRRGLSWERRSEQEKAEVASLAAVQSALFWCSLAVSRKIGMDSTKSIAACLSASKKHRLETGVSGTRVSSVDPTSGLSAEVASVSKKAKKAGPVVQASEVIDVGNGTDRADKDGSSSKASEDQEEIAPAEEKASELNKEQKMRMELNKAIARAKRNLRTCEGHIAESLAQGESFPAFRHLLAEQTWMDALKEEFSKQYMSTLHTFVQQEAKGKLPIYPPPALVFNAFNTCPFDKVKVVIIGQDPYHGPLQAMGLSFSVPQGVKVPSSLVNIFKEIRDDVGCPIPSHGNLEKWAHQGVLMLNAVLTVREHHANSHAKKGWEPFTDAAIRAVSQHKKGVIFLLWGNSAQDKTRLINTKVHHILKAAHPSGLSAHKGFFKCRHFSKTNEILEKAGELPIDWKL